MSPAATTYQSHSKGRRSQCVLYTGIRPYHRIAISPGLAAIAGSCWPSSFPCRPSMHIRSDDLQTLGFRTGTALTRAIVASINALISVLKRSFPKAAA